MTRIGSPRKGSHKTGRDSNKQPCKMSANEALVGARKKVCFIIWVLSTPVTGLEGCCAHLSRAWMGLLCTLVTCMHGCVVHTVPGLCKHARGLGRVCCALPSRSWIGVLCTLITCSNGCVVHTVTGLCTPAMGLGEVCCALPSRARYQTIPASKALSNKI